VNRSKIISFLLILISFSLALMSRDKGITFFCSFFGAVLLGAMIFSGKKKSIGKIPLYGLYRRKDGRLFFKITDQLQMCLRPKSFGDALVVGTREELYRIGSSEKFDPHEIVVLKKRFKNPLHPDLHLDRDYTAQVN